MTIRARIFRSSKRHFECQLHDSKEIVTATALANLLKEDHIVVGDWIDLSPPGAGSEEWKIEKVIPRTSSVFRNLPREQRKKVIAANVDVILIVVSAGKPAFKRGLIDRYLVRSDFWDVPAFVVFNKMDLYDENEFDIVYETDRLQWLNAQCFEVSAEHPNRDAQYLKNNFQDLKDKLKGKTAVTLGHSGVGKSKLISALTDGKVNLLSGELGKIGKGAHTTTWAELVDAENFALIDSPGVRSMSLEDLTKQDLLYSFSDVNEWAAKCQFSSSCTHEPGSRGCFFDKLDPKKREDQMILSRLESYKRILDEVATVPDWAKKS